MKTSLLKKKRNWKDGEQARHNYRNFYHKELIFQMVALFKIVLIKKSLWTLSQQILSHCSWGNTRVVSRKFLVTFLSTNHIYNLIFCVSVWRQLIQHTHSHQHYKSCLNEAYQTHINFIYKAIHSHLALRNTRQTSAL